MKRPAMVTTAAILGLLTPSAALTQDRTDPVQWRIINGGNGHWYKEVRTGTRIRWDEANYAASVATWKGLPGHLVTVSSQAEYDFLFSIPTDDTYWIGAVQGEHIYPGDPAENWTWVTGESWDYEHWMGWYWNPQPGDNSGDEQWAYWREARDGDIPDGWYDGRIEGWHDGAYIYAYMVEFEGHPIGDFDHDGDTDLDDANAFTACMRGPNVPYFFGGCNVFDFNEDSDVDAADYAEFQVVFSWP